MILLQGLTSHDPHLQTLATEAFVNAAHRNTLKIQTLGLLASDIYSYNTPLPRFTKALKQIIDIAPSLSATVQQLVADTLRFDPSSPPRSTAGLIELLNELVLRDGVLFEPTNAMEFLANVKPSSSAGKAAGKVLVHLQKLAS